MAEKNLKSSTNNLSIVYLKKELLYFSEDFRKNEIIQKITEEYIMEENRIALKGIDYNL
jgi:hypothetical protein